MSEDVKLEVIKSTQDALSKYIKKPPLTEKLLRKPPFRYLHDITTAVMKETGYLQGLYSLDELNPENIKDREAKITFLEKLIAAVNLSTGVNITARPNKIVAGLDVAKTNELLQAIGKALEKNVDSSEAVDLVLNKKSKGVSVAKKENPKTKTTKDTKTVDTKSREPRTSEALKKKNKEKTKPVEKTDSRKVKTKKDVSPTKSTKAPSTEEQSSNATKEKSKHQSTRDKEEHAPLETLHDESAKTQGIISPPPTTSLEPLPTPENHVEISGQVKKEPEERREVKQEEVVNEEKKRVESGKETKVVADVRKKEKDLNKEKALIEDAVLGTKLKTHGDIEKDSNFNEDVAKENNLKVEEETRRPQSARAVHRKKAVRKQNGDLDTDSPTRAISSSRDEVFPNEKSNDKPKDLLEDKLQMPVKSEKETKRPRTAARPASARPGAPRVRDRGVTSLADNDTKLVSEPINLIVDTKDMPEDDDNTLVTVEAPPPPEAVIDQVMDDSQLLTGDQGHLVSQILETQKELDTSIASESLQKVDISWAGNKRQQETVVKEVERLRTAIQALTRAANPLGKLIDFLQEDIEAMQSELEMWTTTNQQLVKELQAEERLTEESIEPLTRQLEDIDQLVEEQLEEISLVKAVIIRNDERIVKLLKTNTPNLPG